MPCRALSAAEVAQYEQDDDDGADEPNDLIHDNCPLIALEEFRQASRAMPVCHTASTLRLSRLNFCSLAYRALRFAGGALPLAQRGARTRQVRDQPDRPTRPDPTRRAIRRDPQHGSRAPWRRRAAP